MMKFSRNDMVLYISFFCVFYIMNIFTPFSGDDFGYTFNYEDGSRIRNICDVFESQIAHYQTVNGRLIPHIFEQIFAGITGKWLFDIINTFFILALIFIVSDFCTLSEDKDYRRIITVCVALALLFLFAYPGQTVFWMAGALNYLWPTVFALFLLRVFKQEKTINLWIVAFLSLCCAWFQEAISIPMACLFWSLLLKKEYRNQKNITIALFYTIGTCLIVFSPGTLHRLFRNEIPVRGSILHIVTLRLLNAIAALDELYIWIICLLLCLWGIIFKKRSLFIHSKVEWFLWGINSLFVFALGFGEERITLLLSVLSFILLFRQLDYIHLHIPCKYTLIILLLLFYSSGLFATNKIYRYHTWLEEIIHKIESNPSKGIVLTVDEYPVLSRYYYILDIKNDTRLLSYFDKKKIQVLTSKEYTYFIENSPEKRKKENRLYQSMGKEVKLYCVDEKWMLELPAEYYYRKISILAYHKKDDSQLSRKQLFIRSILNTLDNGTSEIEVLPILKDSICYGYFSPLAKKETGFSLIDMETNHEIYTFKKTSIE